MFKDKSGHPPLLGLKRTASRWEKREKTYPKKICGELNFVITSKSLVMSAFCVELYSSVITLKIVNGTHNGTYTCDVRSHTNDKFADKKYIEVTVKPNCKYIDTPLRY